VSRFDDPDWTAIWVLTWVWLRDKTLFGRRFYRQIIRPDGSKSRVQTTLTGVRLSIYGARRGAPTEVPTATAEPPLPRMMTAEFPADERFTLAPAPANVDPDLMTKRAAEAEIHAKSRAGEVRWSGRLNGSGPRLSIPKLDFIDMKIDFDDGEMRGPDPRHRWTDLRAERGQVLDLWPERTAQQQATSAPSTLEPSDQSAPDPNTPEPSDQSAPDPNAPEPSDEQKVLDWITQEATKQPPRLRHLLAAKVLPAERSRAAWPERLYPLKPGRPPKK
jgi:hypothetical protein